MMEKISSKDNKQIRLVRKLAQKKYRDELAQFVAEGPNLVPAALDCGADILFAVFSREKTELTEENKSLAERLQAAGIPVYEVDDGLFREISDTETPQGMLAVIARPAYSPVDLFGEADHPEHASQAAKGNIVILDRLQDPGNIGTILRTADAAGYRGAIVIKGSGDVYSPKAVRATAGSVFRVPMLFMDSAEETVSMLRSHDRKIICTTPRGNALLYDIDMSDGIALIIGNEANGAGDFFIEQSDHQIRIPMEGAIESLNASVAAGILMYETVRQKLK